MDGKLQINDKYKFKGVQTPINERLGHNLIGFLPPLPLSTELHVSRYITRLGLCKSGLDKYMCLMNLYDSDIETFFSVIMADLATTLPIVYTPTVGLACQNYHIIFDKPKGIFLPFDESSQMKEYLQMWPFKNIKIIVVTDGERILGLGDLGINGMGICVGKSILYTALAGVHPKQILPIVLDTGTNNTDLLEDPHYMGTKRRRETDKEYNNFIKLFMKTAIETYGPDTLIHFEDFGNANAFRLLDLYQESYCCFNDDIQGTAAVVLAALISACKLTKKLSEHTYLFYGAGEAAMGISMLLIRFMGKEGLSADESRARIFMMDSKGLLVTSRMTQYDSKMKKAFAKPNLEQQTSLTKVVASIKPSVLIGVSAQKGAFSQSVLHLMESLNEYPIIMPLSNPISHSECSAMEAYTHTKERCLFASGSPYPPLGNCTIEMNPSQANNAYIFPAIGLAVSIARIRPIHQDLFVQASITLASLMTSPDFAEGRILPPFSRIRQISAEIACQVIRTAYSMNLAHLIPCPVDVEYLVRSHTYTPPFTVKA